MADLYGSKAMLFGVHISGLPWIWLSGPLPSSWGTTTLSYGGETYTPSARLVIPDGLELEESAEPWAGIATAGDCSISIQLQGGGWSHDCTARGPTLTTVTDPIFAVICASQRRGACSQHVTTDLSSTDTAIQLEDASDFAAAGLAFAGLETVSYSSIVSDALTGCTRGLYGSQARPMRASFESVEQTGDGGAWVADHPLVLAGRVLTLHAHPGRLVAGVFVPDSAAYGDSSSILLWRGIVTGVELSADLGYATLGARSLLSLLDLEVGRVLPRHTAGHWHPGVVYVGPDNRRVAFATDLNVDGVSFAILSVLMLRVSTDLVYGGSTIAEGFYSVAQISAALSETNPDLNGWKYQIQEFLDEDGERRCRFLATTRDSGWSENYTITLKAEPGTIWRELGWTQDATGTIEDVGGGSATYWQVTIEADEPMCAARLPRESPGRWIPYTKSGGTDFDATPGPRDDDGVNVSAFVKLGDEILEVDAFSSTTLGSMTIYYAGVVGRGRFGSQIQEHYLAQGSSADERQLTQVIGLPGVSWPRALLYLMRSGSGEASGWSTMWWGCGPGVDADLVDETGIEDVSYELPATLRDHCVVETVSLADLFRGDLVLSQASLHMSDGQLTISPYRQIDEYEGLSALEVGLDHVATRKGVQLELSEGRIANVIRGTNGAFDAALGSGAVTVEHSHGTSTGTYGSATPVEIDLRGCGSAESCVQILHDAAQRLYGLFCRPFPVLTLAIVDSSRVWSVGLHDLVSITHPGIPDAETASWGIEDELGLVLGRRVRVRDGSTEATRGSLLVALLRWRGWRHSRLCPCARVASIAGGSNEELTCTANYYATTAAGHDVTFFEAGDRVRLYQPGDESGAESRIIDSIAGDVITLTAGTALTAPVVVEFAGYNTASYQDRQYAHVHMCDSDRALRRSSGQDDDPYQWS